MSTDAVNLFHRFEIGDSLFQVKSLGLAEMISASATIIRQNLRNELKLDAKEYFPDDPSSRVEYILKTQEGWPKGDEMESLATDFMLSGHGMDELNIYALRRFNKKLREGTEAHDAYHTLELEDQMEMATIVMGTFAETMGVYMTELSRAMAAKASNDAETDDEEIDSEGDEKKPTPNPSDEQ